MDDDEDILLGWIPPKTVVKGRMFTNAALERRDRAVRNEALEEAARVCEALDPEKPSNWLHRREHIAAAIRALALDDFCPDCGKHLASECRCKEVREGR